jgi:hypothetical protein
MRYRFLLVLFWCVSGTGCDTPGTIKIDLASDVKMNESTKELLGHLPNLGPLLPSTCSFNRSSTTVKSDLPSPSDITVIITGWMKPSDSGFDKLESSTDWKALDRGSIPLEIIDQIPAGKVLTSLKWNRSFNSNPTMAHGVLFLIEEDKLKRVWFIAQDLDHPVRLDSK